MNTGRHYRTNKHATLTVQEWAFLYPEYGKSFLSFKHNRTLRGNRQGKVPRVRRICRKWLEGNKLLDAPVAISMFTFRCPCGNCDFCLSLHVMQSSMFTFRCPCVICDFCLSLHVIQSSTFTFRCPCGNCHFCLSLHIMQLLLSRLTPYSKIC